MPVQRSGTEGTLGPADRGLQAAAAALRDHAARLATTCTELIPLASASSTAWGRDVRHIHEAVSRLGGQVHALELEDLVALNHHPDRVAQLRHDLRTPINHVIGYAELVADQLSDEDPSAVQSTLTGLQRVTEQARALLEQVAALVEAPDLPGEPLEASRSSFAIASLSRAADSPSQAPEAVARVLVVDDDPINRDMLTRRLRRMGYAVKALSNGPDAMDLCRRKPPDLLLLDVLMPAPGGYEVLLAMKQDSGLREIPVIMISALDELDSVARCIEAGAQDYLPKVADPILLRARITACLEQKRLREAERSYLQCASQIAQAAGRLEAGDFDPKFLGEAARRADELGQLARTFNKMAGEVQERQRRLEHQVRALRIEIDEHRKASAVAEIAESDYFLNLQKKARDMRRTHRGGQAESGRTDPGGGNNP